MKVTENLVSCPMPLSSFGHFDRLCLQDIGTLATFNKELGELQDAAIYVSGNTIRWVGATKDLPSQYSTADSVISLPDRVMIPGLVNTHHHMFQCLTRCIAQVCLLSGCACMRVAAAQETHIFLQLSTQDSKLFGWLTTLYHAWGHLTVSDGMCPTLFQCAGQHC